MMEAMGQAQEILGYLGQFSTLAVLIMPAFTTIKDAWKADSVGERSPFPFLAALFNSAVWILCGIIDHDNFVKWLSVGGTIVQALYFSFFMVYSTATQRRWWIGPCFAVAILYGIILWFFLTGRTSQFDYLCGASGMLVALSPLFNLPTVYHSVSMDCMPPWAVPLTSLVNSAVWTNYAYAGTKVLGFIAAPHITTLVTTSVQLVLHGCCRIIEWPELGELDVGLLEDQEA